MVCLLLPVFFVTASAGVANPDLSVIGQLVSHQTDDRASQDANTPTLNLGETEFVFDAYLNPYAKGMFVFSVGTGGFSTEEAYLNIIKGIPDGMALKGGKYRVGFGLLNPVHPHAYPFIDTPRSLAALLPGGEDGFNDVGAQASFFLPSVGNWASTITGDVLNGSSFHPDETKASAAWVCRLGNSFLFNDSIPLEVGFSATQGTNNVQWNTRTGVYGGDVKTKLPLTGQANLTLQGEYLYNSSSIVVDSTTGHFDTVNRSGLYTFANLQFRQRYNAGIMYDQYQPQENSTGIDRSVKVFLGYALMEETTLFRVAYERFFPGGADPVNTVSFQVLFSMGPHKPHQF